MSKPRKTKASRLGDLKATLLESLKARLSAGCTVYAATDSPYLAPPRGYTPTGLYGLDTVLTKGKGVPWGRFLEVFGAEGSGKTAMCEKLIGVFKDEGSVPHYFDFEASFDPAHLACYGVKAEDVLLPDAECIEDAWNYICTTMQITEERRAARTKAGGDADDEPPAPFFWDSVAQTPSRKEMEEKGHDDAHVADVARAMAKGFRKHTRSFSKTNGVVVFVNQVRDVIGAFGRGPKTRTPGGRALKFAYAIRLRLDKVETLKSGDTPIGQICRVTTVKNKFCPYPLSTDIVLSYKRGIDTDWSNFRWLQENRQILPAGENKEKKRVFKLRGQKATFTRTGFGEYASANPDLIKEAVIAARARVLPESTSSDDDPDASDSDE